MKKSFKKKKKRVKGFFVFMTMLWFKQVEFNYRKQESCEQGCSWIVKFSHCLHFQYHIYGIIFSIRTQNGCSNCTDEEKKSVK